MPFYLYGAKNGISSVIKFVRSLCRVYTAFSGAIIAYVNSSSLSSENKTLVINWLNNASTVCGLLETSIQVVPEPLG